MLTILKGDWIEQLRTLPDESAHCCVTSPPYWGLRDYGVAGQLGLEPTINEYVAKVVKGFEEVRRVLRKDGTCWVNLGDSYSSVPSWGRDNGTSNLGGSRPRVYRKGADCDPKRGEAAPGQPWRHCQNSKAKNLCGIPWRVAFALQSAGWYLRADIIWHKPNPIPESVTDRPTKAHEYIFLLSKSPKYFYDAEAIKEQVTGGAHSRRAVFPAGWGQGGEPRTSIELQKNGTHRKTKPAGVGPKSTPPGSGVRNNESFSAAVVDLVESRNKRTVWTVPSAPFKGAHFATFPPDLIKPCILAGCPTSGTVLDPFGGSGTTGMVALELGRKAILIELNSDYCRMIEQRCNVTPGLNLVTHPTQPHANAYA